MNYEAIINNWILVFALAFGLAIGSFLNVLVYRLPRRQDFVRGFSHCPACRHRLHAKDLIPLASCLFLRGRCRYCGARISPRYFLVEAVTGAAFLLLFLTGRNAWQAALGCAVFSILLCITLIDADTREIPDSLNIALALCGILAIWLMPEVTLPARLIGIVCASLPMLLLAFAVEGAFGGGDIKLMAAAGLLLGWQNTLLAFFVGIILGGLYGAALLVSGRRGWKEHFAFGPCLCVGILAALFCGEHVIGWYLGLF
jgi:leader peptidase (prepilin peptidase)/N-methyltransferase